MLPPGAAQMPCSSHRERVVGTRLVSGCTIVDPISVTASLITLAGLAAKTCSAFKALRDICNTLPGRLHALNNEVADFQVVCHQVLAVLDDRAAKAYVDTHIDSPIRHLILQAKDKLLELKRVVSSIVTSSRRSRIVAVQAWKKHQTRLEKLQEDLKTVKCSLNLLLGAAHSRDLTRICVELESISTVTSHSAENQNVIRDEMRESLVAHHDSVSNSVSGMYQQVDERIGRVEEMLKERSERLRTQQSNQLSPLYGAPPPPYRRRRSSQQSVSSLSPAKDPRTDAVSIRKTYTPAVIERVLGKLFVGYSGLPLISPKCNTTHCDKAQSARVRMEYWFPMSFMSQIVSFQLVFENTGPQVALNFLRLVPDTAQSVGFAQAGNVHGLKDLFKRGLASPRDWAVYTKQWDMCKFLVLAGADSDYRPIAAYDNSPRNKACDFNFTILHKIATGLSYQDLEEALILHHDEIDALDAMHRTVLAWASARGNDRAVALLLAHGADPNVLDIQWTNAVSYAAERSHLVCVRLLLEAGAEPDPQLPKGIKVGSALNCTSRNCSDPLVLKTLLDFGANIEASGVDGITPLIHVARTDNVNFAMTPLSTAITYNSHKVIRLLLDRWFEYSTCPRLQGPHLLRTAALFADLETVKILTATDHFKLKYDKNFLLSDCLDQLKERFDATDELIAAFQDLLSVFNGEPEAMMTKEKILESGLLSWGKCPGDGNETDTDGSFEDALESHGTCNRGKAGGHSLIDI
ncbi:ankyrin [Mytilinidion resinicola]|uniref:Ankyrin n=1 Tax=Mytilinidion resinicola TaxID=574789 RepID=A0A6A6YPU1_9PEZI|nr:ankyrin [Mytilinidion resinicola]KAF2810800.1 ankyrin [Mytilinidion resinicola]